MGERWRVLWALGLVCLSASAMAGCGAQDDTPRSEDRILEERQSLPAVFLTVKTGKRVLAPGDRTFLFDKTSGEAAWRALACPAADCPGRGSDGQPFLYIAPDLGIEVTESGARPASKAVQDPSLGYCPECWAKKNLAKAPAAELLKYANAQPYVLPESAKREAELDAELKRRIEYVNKLRGGK